MFPLLGSTKALARGGRATGGGLLQERAPLLKEAVGRLAGAVVKDLQKMAGTTTTIEGTMAGATLEPLREVVAAHSADAVAGLIECAALDCKLLVTLNGQLVHSIVELLAGGDGLEPPPDTPRAATAIDHQFSLILVTVAAAAIRSEWADLGFGPTRAAKIEGPLVADLLGTRIAEVAVVRLTIGAFGQYGTLRLVLPPPALERFRHEEVADTTAGGDAHWRDLLHTEIGRASVTLDAYLEAKPVALSALAALKVGQILTLPGDSRARVSLICDGATLYRGEVGQDDGRYSLRIEEVVSEMPAAAGFERSPHRRPPLDLPRA